MAFKLRSSKSNTNSPVQQSLETLKSQYSSYQKDGSGNYTRTYEAENEKVNRNRSQSKAVAANLYNRASRGEDSEGYAGGNSGSLFSSKKTIGGTSARSTRLNDNYNTPSEKEIFKTLNKYGSAEIVDGVVKGKNTHTETKTINEKQYNKLGKKVARAERIVSTRTSAKNKRKKENELKKQQLASRKQTKINSYLNAKNKKKKELELKKQKLATKNKNK